MKIKLSGLFPHFPLLFKTSLHTFRFQSMFSASPIKNYNQEVFTENKKPGNTKPHVLAMSPPRTILFSTHRFTTLEKEGFSSVGCVLAVEPTQPNKLSLRWTDSKPYCKAHRDNTFHYINSNKQEQTKRQVLTIETWPWTSSVTPLMAPHCHSSNKHHATAGPHPVTTACHNGRGLHTTKPQLI